MVINDFINFNVSVKICGFVCLDMKETAEETGSTSTAAKNVVEKGEVEATKEKGNEKEKEKEKEEKEEDKNKKKDKSEKEDNDKDAGSEQEIVFIQDMGFTVKIVSPGAEPFDIQVSSMELVQVSNHLFKDFFLYDKKKIYTFLFTIIENKKRSK